MNKSELEKAFDKAAEKVIEKVNDAKPDEENPVTELIFGMHTVMVCSMLRKEFFKNVEEK